MNSYNYHEGMMLIYLWMFKQHLIYVADLLSKYHNPNS